MLRVESGGAQYDYAADALQLVVTFDTVKRFDVMPQQVERALQINASLRAQLVKSPPISPRTPGCSTTPSASKARRIASSTFSPSRASSGVDDKVRDYERELLGVDFSKLGAWRFEGKTLRVADHQRARRGRRVSSCRRWSVNSTSASHQARHRPRAQGQSRLARQSRQRHPRASPKKSVDRCSPSSPTKPDARDDVAPHDRYLKTQTVARALPSLILHESTLHKVEAMPQLIMGLMARAGGTPFAFEEPLPYADLLVGLAVQRAIKKDGNTSRRWRGCYSNRGVALGWRAARATTPEGAGLPDEMLAQLLPPKQIPNKRDAAAR